MKAHFGNWARGSAGVLYVTNRRYGDPKSEGGGDDLQMYHRLTEMPRPREIEVGGGRFRRESMTTLPGNQVRRGSEQPARGLWMPRDSGAEEIGELADVKTTVHR